MASGGALCTSLSDSGFPLRLGPAFPETFEQFLRTGCFAHGQMTRPRLFQLWPAGKRLTPRMQKDQVGVTRSGQGGFRANSVDPSLLFGNFPRCFGFGPIALVAFVLFQPSLRDQQPPIE
jgi:hypothetical protein